VEKQVGDTLVLEKQTAYQNVIAFTLDADAFRERGKSYLERNELIRAEKLLRRAYEIDPGEANDVLQLAMVYTMLEQFDRSNELLMSIADEGDLCICYYFMSINFLNQDKFEEAESMALKYLSTDDLGIYLDDALEVVTACVQHLGRVCEDIVIKAREADYEHEQARRLLEEEHFQEAITSFEELLKKSPENPSAWNDLAMAYYYCHQNERALRLLKETNDRFFGNIETLCNIAVILNPRSTYYKRIIKELKILVPLNTKDTYKIAMTFCMKQEHEAAYPHLLRLLKQEQLMDNEHLLHYTAVAAFYTGHYMDAKRHWTRLLKVAPKNKAAQYYLARFRAMKEAAQLQLADEEMPRYIF
jgi:tetratricopeptide (TPR) repeat protein